MIFALRCGGQDWIRRSYEYDQRQTHRQCLEDFDMPHADIKCTTDLEIDVRVLMLDMRKQYCNLTQALVSVREGSYELTNITILT